MTAYPGQCKICDGASPLFGVCDFTRSCEERTGLVLPLSGEPIYYRRCSNCGLIFTDAFDAWTVRDWRSRIYNDAYGMVDPDYDSARPVATAHMVAALFKPVLGQLSVLDYGGGNGRFAVELRALGAQKVTTYDPFSRAFHEPPVEPVQLVTCFEAIEHSPRPRETAQAIAAQIADGGALMLSTLTQPDDIELQRMAWWYAAPRNGHVTLFSRRALATLFAQVGLRVYPLNPDCSVALVCRSPRGWDQLSTLLTAVLSANATRPLETAPW